MEPRNHVIKWTDINIDKDLGNDDFDNGTSSIDSGWFIRLVIGGQLPRFLPDIEPIFAAVLGC